jgi:predicted alpha/beta-fold hydrolase
VLKLRAGISIKNISTQAEDIDKRTLIIHSADDPTVPQTASKALASARPDLVTLADFKRGGHVRSWNHDQLRYEKLITDILSQ